MPFLTDRASFGSAFNKKLDLNLHCIKRPEQTCLIEVTNPNMLTWGIEAGDMLVVEKHEHLNIGDLVVMELANQFCVYELANYDGKEFVFFALDAKMKSIKSQKWTELPIIGVITNTIHQIKPRTQMKFAA
ncbi:LexA family transcriptional regulator [Avibacterium sp. 21-586]|nr:S24 family peptidase [Avibacterium sp. 21-586]MCW9709486.1 LexA family transcriptional regulator [Avibacterium sp. 21-586]